MEGVRKGHCCSFTANDVWWTRDEFFSAAANLPIINEILQKEIAEQVLAEKAEAVAIWRQIESLSKEIVYPADKLKEAIQVSCSYGRIKYQLIESMWVLMLVKGRIDRGMEVDSFNRQSQNMINYGMNGGCWNIPVNSVLQFIRI